MHRDFHILLVDDSPTDAQIIARALREGGINHRLTVITDGRFALDYLTNLASPDCPPDLEPDLVLLDLNLPGLDGLQVLAAIKADPLLSCLPVVILTTSDREEDVLQTYRSGANTFIQKPAEYPPYRELVATLHRYWRGTALLPPRVRDRSRPPP